MAALVARDGIDSPVAEDPTGLADVAGGVRSEDEVDAGGVLVAVRVEVDTLDGAAAERGGDVAD